MWQPQSVNKSRDEQTTYERWLIGAAVNQEDTARPRFTRRSSEAATPKQHVPAECIYTNGFVKVRHIPGKRAEYERGVRCRGDVER